MSTALVVRDHGALAVEVSPDAITHKAALLADAQAVSAVADEFTAEVAVEVVREIKNALAAVEKARETVKRPFLEFGRAIDGAAKGYAAELNAEAVRLGGLVSRYNAAQAAKRAEAERQAQEAIRIAAEKQRAAEEAARAAQAPPPPPPPPPAPSPLPPAPEKIAGTVQKTVWRWEVIDLEELIRADLAQRRPGLVRYEPSAQGIHLAIGAGMREFPGLRIWSEEVTEIRR